MKIRSRLRAIATLACLLGGAGCVGNDGTPIFVDYAAIEVWSGKGMLLEVSPDQNRCLVRVRDDYLIVRERWVSCLHVHPRRAR